MTLQRLKGIPGLLAAMLTLAWATTPASAADGHSPAIEAVKLSRALFDIGMKQEDPLLVLAAAQLRLQAGVQETESHNNGLAPVNRASPASGGWITWSDMADAAAGLAENDPALLEKAQQMGIGARGRRDGPARTDDYVSAGQKNVYFSVAFRGGKFAHVYVEGSGATDLDLFIYNGKGQLICSDTDASDRSYCGWVPGATEPFSITVVNKGNLSNAYSLITN